MSLSGYNDLEQYFEVPFADFDLLGIQAKTDLAAECFALDSNSFQFNIEDYWIMVNPPLLFHPGMITNLSCVLISVLVSGSSLTNITGDLILSLKMAIAARLATLLLPRI